MKGFARREFQLVLLRRMQDYRPDLVDPAVSALGASRTEMREVNARWQRMLRSRSFPNGRRRLAAVLGPPAEEGTRRLGEVECRIERWPLALWPGLPYEAMTAPDGTVLQEWLVRAGDVPAPEPRTVEELEPWRHVVGDMERLGDRFGTVRHFPGETPSRWHVEFTADGHPFAAHFVWGLLQTVESTGRTARRS